MGGLVGITETKAFMQVTGTASDALISTYIDLIEGEIEAYVDRNLIQGTYTESLSYLQSSFDQSSYTLMDASTGSPSLFLDNYPVIQLTLTSSGSEVTSTDYYLDQTSGVISSSNQYSEPTATYVAGYTTETAPNDLKFVVLSGVKSLFDNNTASSSSSKGNVKSKRIKDFSVDYGNEQTGYITNSNGMLVKNYIAANKVTLDRYLKVTV